MKAPDLHLPDLKSKWVLVYFYPKDDTPGCTKEACSFRDHLAEFKKRGLAVVGVSKDTVASHAKFTAKYHLNFPLISDPDHELIEKFGAWGEKNFMGRKYMGTLRNSYLINPAGDIVKEYKSVNPLTHSSQILADFDSIAK